MIQNSRFKIQNLTREKEQKAEDFKKKLKVECSKRMIQGSKLCSAR
jgi:hypothetical protein